METRKYETVVVFDDALGEARIKSDMKKVQGIFESNGAAGITVEQWGRQEIPHLVGRYTPGNYVCYTFEGGESNLIDTVEGLLRITEGVVRFQTHRIRERHRKFKGNPKAKIASDGDEDFSEVAENEF